MGETLRRNAGCRRDEMSVWLLDQLTLFYILEHECLNAPKGVAAVGAASFPDLQTASGGPRGR